MTEKRFKLVNPNNKFKNMNIGIVEDGTCMLKLTDVVDLLNILDARKSEYREMVDKLVDENEQLKQSLENKMNSDNYWEQKATEKIKELEDKNEQLKQQIAELQYSKKMLRITNKDLELGIRRLRKSFDDFDKMRVEHIQFLQKRMKKYGISIYYNDGDDE